MMATRRIELGATGETVRANVRRVRGSLGWSLRQLSERLAVGTRPLTAQMLSEIENGSRRVDVDDLMALAHALGVTPNVLLLPPTAREDDSIQLTGAGNTTAALAWDWADGIGPLVLTDPDDDESVAFEHIAFLARTLPRGRNADELMSDLVQESMTRIRSEDRRRLIRRMHETRATDGER